MGVLVSVIVPVKNEAKNIKRFIKGVKKQTYRLIEVLLIDGDSMDGTREIVKDMAENLSEPTLSIRLLKEEDYGALRSPANARNIGVKESRGSYVVFLDADFDLNPDETAIEKIVKALHESEHVAITFVPNMHTWVEKGIALDEIIYYKPVWDMAFRREVFNRALFDPNLGLWEGRDFLQRISTKPLIVDTKIRRCYPHTFKEYMREQIWYGRTILRYYRKVKFKKWPVEIIRSNAILGLISLSFLISPLSVLVASLLPIVATFIIVRRWLRKDVAFFGPQNIRKY